MKLRFAPFWYDRVPTSRRPARPRHRGHIDTAVAIVGGGLTGCACAWTFASAGIPVVLLEAVRVGSGGTAGGVGLVRHDFDRSFDEAVAALGLRAARSLWQAMRRSALDLEAVLRRLQIRCDLSRQDLLRMAPTDTPGARRLRREYEARRHAGLDDDRWMTPGSILRETALEAAGGIRARAAVLDPYRACAGLARAAEERGAMLFEHSPVKRIRATGSAIEIATANGTLTAEAVVVATGAPIVDLRPLRRHLHPRQAYGVVTDRLSAQVRRQLGARTLTLQDGADPPHVVRWLREDRALVAGAPQEPVPVRSQDTALVQRTGQLMYELSLLFPAISGTRPAWGWSFPFDDTVDGLPYLGTHRNFPRHLFALGVGRHGPAASWMAARLLVRQFLGEPAKGDELLGFARILH